MTSSTWWEEGCWAKDSNVSATRSAESMARRSNELWTVALSHRGVFTAPRVRVDTLIPWLRSSSARQRVKLASELHKRSTGRTVYVLDEPTTGLHFHDIALLLKVLHQLREAGNTIVVIEHNLDVIKTADWIVDLGPDGGRRGGTIVAAGTPEDVAKAKGSHTGHYLSQILGRR